MRCSAALATFLFYSTLVFSQSTSPIKAGDHSVRSLSLLYGTDEESIFNFNIACSRVCGEDDTNLMFDFGVRRTERACDGTGLSLNGAELTLSVNDGPIAQGSGIIPTIAGQSSLSAKWQSACITVPRVLSDDHTAQLLTVQIDRVGEVDLSEDIAFTVILTQVGMPQILNLRTSASNDSIHCSSDGERESQDSLQCLNFHANSESQPPQRSVEWHWDYLQSLEATVGNLHRRIEIEKGRLQEMRQQECTSPVQEQENCQKFGCKFKASVMKVPDLFGQIKEQLGLGPSATGDTFCSWCPQHTRCASGPTPSKPDISSGPSVIPNLPDDGFSTSHTPVSNLDAAGLQSTLSQSMTQYYLTICTAIFLVTIAFSITIFICRNTTCGQRRRVDRATCREERRTQRAYRVAARRHRFRQWWEGTTTPTVIVTPDNDLHSVTDRQSQIQEPDTMSTVSVEPDTMQAEIWGFRQALDYVRELVRSPSQDLERAEPHGVSTDHDIVELLNRRRMKSPSSVASSTAGLSTAISIGTTNSLLSLETGSSATVDTLESADPPPSYHS